MFLKTSVLPIHLLSVTSSKLIVCTNIIMKKFFILTVLAIASLSSASAQVTWNVRAGGGVADFIDKEFYSDFTARFSRGKCPAFMVVVESNISFKKGVAWCFSPSFTAHTNFSKRAAFVLPIHVGYKIKTTNDSQLIPKIGIAAGMGGLDHMFGILGPSAALCYEYKHFVVGANYYLNCVTSTTSHQGSNYFISLGYKF